MESELTFAVIGAGKVGTAISLLMQRRGYIPTGVASKSEDSARRLANSLQTPWFCQPEQAIINAKLVLITTSDSVIENIVSKLVTQKALVSGQILLHFSGAYDSSILASARQCGARVGSMHPLQSFAQVETAMENLPGSIFTLEGDVEAVAVAKQITEDIGGAPVSITTEKKAVYHAAACVASNYLITLYSLAEQMMTEAGLSVLEAQKGLLPLMQGTLNNLKQIGLPQALTGPLARGDVETVARHLRALHECSAIQDGFYRYLGEATLPIAEAKGTLDIQTVNKLKSMFRGKASERQDHNTGT